MEVNQQQQNASLQDDDELQVNHQRESLQLAITNGLPETDDLVSPASSTPSKEPAAVSFAFSDKDDAEEIAVKYPKRKWAASESEDEDALAPVRKKTKPWEHWTPL